MQKIILLTLSLLLCLSLTAREKTMTIGKCTWLTEQNTIQEVAAKAKKENKPILAVFSATWCGPCQLVKKNVFKKAEFQKVADKAVLLYIEQTDPKGMEYCKTYKVSGYPTFMAFNQKGVVSDTGQPQRTVEGFSKWMDEVKKGNTRLAIENRLKKNPNDRQAMLDLDAKIKYHDWKARSANLEKVTGASPDYKDPLTRKAC
ncbi:MAG: thioredoxin family protein, partial [bacterium]|nr:thioredoxin family protein [bacterium]